MSASFAQDLKGSTHWKIMQVTRCLLVHKPVEPDVEVPPHIRVVRDAADAPERNAICFTSQLITHNKAVQ